jgi:hypothetical protein
VTQLKYDEAFDLLERNNGASIDLTELSHLKARYQHWKQHERDKTADSRDLEVEINKIRYTLLTFSGQVKQ